MDIAEQIRGLIEDIDGCNLVAFADISSKMVLVYQANVSTPQEDLDGLCFEAAAALNGASASLNEASAPMTAIVTNSTGSNVFLRATPESNDVLCCTCAPDVDINALFSAARDRLESISQNVEN